MVYPNPPGYRGNFTVLSPKNWFRVLFNQSKFVQSAELNDLQTIIQDQLGKGFSGIFSDGQFLSGGVPTVSTTGGVTSVNITAGLIFAVELFQNIPAGSCVITGVGNEVVYLTIAEDTITATGANGTTQDTSLNDPASGAEAFNKPAADRLGFVYSYTLNSGTVPVVTLVNGQIVQSSNSQGLLAQFLATLAQYFFETDGSYLTTLPGLLPSNTDSASNNPTQFTLIVDGGVGYNQGYRAQNKGKTPLAVLKPMTGNSVQDEPQTFLSGTLTYSLNNSPILGMQQVAATLSSGTINMTRGSGTNLDAIPTQYTPVNSIVSVSQSPHGTYTVSSDYIRTGNNVQWTGTGSTPSPGSTYQVVVTYNKVLTQGVRVLTTVTGETHTTSGGSTTALTNSDVSAITQVQNTSTHANYVLGTDYTLNATRTSISWLNVPSSGTGISVNYSYWAHSTEGDFVARDSFQDATGDVLYYAAPSTDVSGNAINYLSQVSLNTTSGNTPVNDTDVDFYYQYTTGRIDVLAWNSQGVLDIVQGTPSANPSPPILDDTYLCIAKLHLPPEATATTMSIEWYANLTQTEVELNTLSQTVDNVLYDLAQFQLQTNAASQTAPTDLIGILADPFTDTTIGDISNPIFSGTYDLINNLFYLPRTAGLANPTVSSVSNAVLDSTQYCYTLPYVEQLAAAQIFYTTPQVVNSFGAVNLNASVASTPGIVMSYATNLTVLVRSTSNLTNLAPAMLANSNLLINLSNPTQSGAALPQSVSTTSQLLGFVNVSQTLLTQSQGWSTAQEGAFYQGSTSAPATATTIVSNTWATVQQQITTNTISASPSETVKLTGSNFRPGDRAVTCTLDGVPLTMTATGSTSQETASGYTNGVQANGSGAWTANITTPANMSDGVHQLNFSAHNLSNGAITSLASCSFGSGLNTTSITEYVTVRPPSKVPCSQVPAYALTGVLGAGTPSAQVISSVSGPFAYTIAYAIAQCVAASVTLNPTLVATAIMTALQETTLGHSGIANTLATAWANAVNVSSNNVTANANAILAVSAYASYAQLPLTSIALCSLDPLAQTFTLANDSFITSVQLWFTNSTADTVQVAIATVEDGIPTGDYLAVAVLPGSSINSNGTATKFTFPTPVFVSGETEYAFIVATNDNLLAVETAVLGKTDLNGGGLVVSNPAVGTMLQSSNGSSWEVVNGQDLRFNINVASFTSTTGTINFGAVTFAQASCIFAFYMPFYLPDGTVGVKFQYSTDNTNWLDYSPAVETNLGGAFGTIYLRVLLLGTSSMSPVVFNSTILQYFIWQLSGTYTHRRITFQSDNEYRFAHVYVNATIPGNTAIACQVSSDDVTWHNATLQSDQLQVSATVTQYHFLFDFGSSNNQLYCRARINLTSTVDSVTPSIGEFRLVCSELD